MSDLISRKALLAKVIDANPMGGMIGGKFIEDLIKTEPTAYDVDKVVEQLGNTHDGICVTDDEALGIKRGLYMAISLLKGAVKNE